MLDGEIADLARTFSALGRDFHHPEMDGADETVDVLVDFYFPNGFRVDQTGATIEVVDTVLTAGFYAAEAFELGVALDDDSPRGLFPDSGLSIDWVLVFAHAGSLDLRATVTRVGGWVSRHKASTLWVLGGLAVLLPEVGLPVIVGSGAPWLVGGAVEGLTWVHDRQTTRAKLVSESAPTPQVIVAAVPTQVGAGDSAPDVVSKRGVHTRLIVLEGNADRNQSFLHRLLTVAGVEPQTRFLGDAEAQGASTSTIKVWSEQPLSADALRSWADETAVLVLDISEETIE